MVKTDIILYESTLEFMSHVIRFTYVIKYMSGSIDQLGWQRGYNSSLFMGGFFFVVKESIY